MSSRIEARWYSQNNMKPRGGEDTHSTFQYPGRSIKGSPPGEHARGNIWGGDGGLMLRRSVWLFHFSFPLRK